MEIQSLMYIVLAASVLALGFAFYFYKSMLKKDEGTDLMKKIAAHVRQGAMAYLKQQYKVVTIVFVILAAIFAGSPSNRRTHNPGRPAPPQSHRQYRCHFQD